MTYKHAKCQNTQKEVQAQGALRPEGRSILRVCNETEGETASIGDIGDLELKMDIDLPERVIIVVLGVGYCLLAYEYYGLKTEITIIKAILKERRGKRR